MLNFFNIQLTIYRLLALSAVFLFSRHTLNAQAWANVISVMPGSVNRSFNVAVEDTVTKTLYIGGNFSSINQHVTNSIIQFDGNNFSTLGTGLDDQFPGALATEVRFMIMFKNKLYVFGNFAKAGATYTRWMARWNGSNWDPVDFKAKGQIKYATVHNNELYVAGSFDSIGGIAANCVARYDGINWNAVSHPVKNNQVGGLASFKGKIYLAGQLSQTSSAANVSCYDGTNWIPVVSPAGDAYRAITGLKVIDSLLYVYGRFSDVIGTNCRGIAAFNGTYWIGLGQGLGSNSWETVYHLEKINGELYACGLFDKMEGVGTSSPSVLYYTNLAKYNGQTWCAISPPFSKQVNGVINFKGSLYSYGTFKGIGVDTCIGFMRWNGGLNPFICSQAVTVYVSSVKENNKVLFNGIKIYPNPASDYIKVEMPGFEELSLQLELRDVSGKIILNKDKIGADEEVDIHHLSKGIYFLTLVSNQANTTIKFIKE